MTTVLADQGACGTLGTSLAALKQGNTAYKSRLRCLIWYWSCITS